MSWVQRRAEDEFGFFSRNLWVARVSEDKSLDSTFQNNHIRCMTLKALLLDAETVKQGNNDKRPPRTQLMWW